MEPSKTWMNAFFLRFLFIFHLVNIFVYLLHVLQGNNSATRKENNCYDKTPSNRVIAELTRECANELFSLMTLTLV
jgi:hypothetical protein